MYPTLDLVPYISLDTETTGLMYPRDKAFFVSISVNPGEEYDWDLRQDNDCIDWFNDVLAKFEGNIFCHNAAFDFKMLSAAGIHLNINKFRCTVVRACLIDEHLSTTFPWTKGKKPGDYTLEYLCQKYLGQGKHGDFYSDMAAEFGGKATRNVQMRNIASAPYEILSPYAKIDARRCLELAMWQIGEIDRQGIHQIVDFEEKLMPTLIRSQMRGIHVDLDEAERAQPKLTEIVTQKQAELDIIAGRKFNVNSPKQVRELFKPVQLDDETWVACDGTALETTDSGQPSFGGDALREITHPAAPLIVEIRSLIKTRDTFLGSHILGHAIDGKVYPTINQTKGEDGGTGTGRLSYTDPAMQQIPARNKKVASIVKPCFLPPPGMVWVEPDLASFEVRVFAHLVAAYNDSLAVAYAENPSLDFHQWVADMTGLVRNATYSGEPNAKQLNLSMIFNQGKGATAKKMGMPWEWSEFTAKNGDTIRYRKAGKEAEEVIALYHQRVQGVKTLAERAKMVAEERGYIKTSFGRRLRFPGKYKTYKASGLLIQSTSADWNKRNWMVIEEALGDNGHIILNTHDSYSLACPKDWRPWFDKVKQAVEDVSDIKSRVPLILDLDGAGSNWWKAKCGEFK